MKTRRSHEPPANSRRAAAFVVARWLVAKEYPSTGLPEGADRAFVQDLAYTAIRRFRTLRFVLEKLVRKMPRGELEATLLVGAAQILYMDDVADYAAVSETVEAAKAAGKGQAGLVNGVLRNIIRRKAEFLAAIAAAPLETRESFPTALTRRWIERYGENGAAELARYFNRPAETWLAYRPGLEMASAEDGFIRLPRGRKVQDTEGYERGEFTVQDPATALAVKAMDVKPGMKVADLCAAPGGKTIQLAWRLRLGEPEGAQSRLLACEVNANRMRRLERNLARCTSGVETAHSIPSPEAGLFDRVLADVPCSNTGVMGRRPDARWNWNPAKSAELVRLQSEILDKAARLVAIGGKLVYSTCSLEPEENDAQVAGFLARHPEFEAGERFESLPQETGHDGAFAHVLVRRR